MNDGTVDLSARVGELEAERTRYFRWAYAAVVALAKDELEVANAAAEPGEWPAQQAWEGLGGSSKEVFMRRARARVGIDHEAFLAPVRDGSIDVDNLFNGEVSGG